MQAPFVAFGVRRLTPAQASVSPGRPFLEMASAFIFLLVLLAGMGTPASAVLIATGDGTGNTTVPVDRPSLAHVGTIGAFSGVYVRNGWVLTTDHVGEGDFVLDQGIYPMVPGSLVRFENPDGTLTDLVAFKLGVLPPVSDLLIANEAPVMGEGITVMGNGRDRGVATTWNGLEGWGWSGAQSLRWGTNQISFLGATILNTESFRTDFDPMASSMPGEHEADLVLGDSGGGAFAVIDTGNGPKEALIGILFARSASPEQPGNTSLDSNDGVVVDLFAYRDEILAVIDQPACSDGLDDDLDGLVDLEDPGCADPDDSSERGAAFECDNGIDDDGNGFIDFPADFGCLDPTGMVEAPEPGFGVLVGSATLFLATLSPRRRSRLRERDQS
ncbi:MAG: hypothetical protein AB8G23_12385 [Myxococcota bacterium]